MAGESPKTIRELLVRLGVVQKDPQAFARFSAGIDKVKAGMAQLGRLALGVTGAAVGVGSALVKITLDTAALGDNLDETAASLQLNVETLQELQFAAGLGGVSAEELGASLKM